jgi:GTPase SAR1 family protein
MASKLLSPLEISLQNLASICRTQPSLGLFVVDGSSSIDPSDFNIVKLVLRSIAKRFPIGPKCSFGLVQFSTNVKTELAPSNDVALVYGAIQGMTQLRTSTSTGLALQHCKQILDNGPETHKFLILLTDGGSNGKPSPIEVAPTLHGKYTIIGVGIGSSVVKDEIFALSSPQHAFFVNSMDELNKQFSANSIEPALPPNISFVTKTTTTARLSVASNDVKSISVEQWSEEDGKKTTIIEQFTSPNAPMFNLRHLSPDTEYSIRISVTFEDGRKSAPSAALRFRTLAKEVEELDFIYDKAKLQAKVDSLRKELREYSRASMIMQRHLGPKEISKVNLDHLNFAILGPAGTGKSTFINSLWYIFQQKYDGIIDQYCIASEDANNVTGTLSSMLLPLDANPDRFLSFVDCWGFNKATPDTMYTDEFLLRFLAGNLPLNNKFSFTGLGEKLKDTNNLKLDSVFSDQVQAVMLLFSAMSFDKSDQITEFMRVLKKVQGTGRKCTLLLSKLDLIDERVQKNPAFIYESDLVQEHISALKQRGLTVDFLPSFPYRFGKETQNLAVDYMNLKVVRQIYSDAAAYCFRAHLQPLEEAYLFSIPKGQPVPPTVIPGYTPGDRQEISNDSIPAKNPVTPVKVTPQKVKVEADLPASPQPPSPAPSSPASEKTVTLKNHNGFGEEHDVFLPNTMVELLALATETLSLGTPATKVYNDKNRVIGDIRMIKDGAVLLFKEDVY